MDDIKREKLEKVCKKIHKVRARMVAVRMVRVLDMSVKETASLQVRCPTWIRYPLRRYDEEYLESFRITAAPLNVRKMISLQEQKYQYHAFPQGFSVPEHRGRVLTSRKAQTARF